MRGRHRLERFLIGERPAFLHGGGGEHHIPAAGFRERARVGGRVGSRLLRGHVIHRLPVSGHGMRRPDVRARRHGRDIRSQREDEAGPRRRVRPQARRTR